MSNKKFIDSIIKSQNFINSELIRVACVPALRLAAAFVQFFATVLIAKVLGSSKAGEFFFWMAMIVALSRVSAFGFDKLSLQKVPRLNSERAVAEFLAPLRTLVLFFSLVIGLGLVSYAVHIHGDDSRSSYWYLLLPLSLSGIALCRINGEAMKGLSHPKTGIMYRQFIAGGMFLTGLLILNENLTPESSMICFASAFAVVGFLAPFGPKFSRFSPQYAIPAVEPLIANLKDALPIFLSSLCAALTYLIPLAILERIHHSDQVAFLTTAYRLFLIFDLLAMSIHSVIMPRLSRAGEAEDWQKLAGLYRQTIKNGILILVIPLLFSIAAPDLIMSMFGEDFRDAAPVLRVFFLFTAVSLLMGPASELVLMMGHNSMMATFSLVRLITAVVLSFILIPYFGAIGMAFAIGCGILLQKTCCVIHFLKHSDGAA